MAKFDVTVTLVKEETYTVQVEADGEGNAENIACGMWREQTSEDFQVDKPSSFKIDEIEQLTFDCEECGKEFPMSELVGDDRCGPCEATLEAEEAEWWRQNQAQQRSAMEE